MSVHDDLYHDWNTQSSSQWDGFRHLGHRDHGHYGGVADEEHGVHHWAARGIVGRAVLADVDRWRAAQGRPLRRASADAITADDLLSCLADQGTAVETGDVLLRAHRVPHVVPVARPRRTGGARGVAADARARAAPTCPACCGTCT